MEIPEIMRAYGLDISKSSRALKGLVNETFIVETPDGQKYVAQRIKNRFGDENPYQATLAEIAENLTLNSVVVLDALKNEDFTTARPLLADGKFCRQADGEIWRVLTYLDNEEPTAADPEVSYLAGDALRSWCKIDTEFRFELFRAGLAGYCQGSGRQISPELAKTATRLITLELAVRYLIDFFEERYFNWNREKFKSAAEHNLHRCRQYIAYYKTI